MKKIPFLILAFLFVGCVNVSVTPGDKMTEDEDMEVVEKTEDKMTEDEKIDLEDGSEKKKDEEKEEAKVKDEDDTDEKTEDHVNQGDSVVDNEDDIGCGGPDCDNQMLIENYYKSIAEGDLELAYAMKYRPEVNFNTFKGWYNNVIYAYVRDYEEVEDETYQFIVDLAEKGDVENSYFVKMRVRDGLLDTISSTNITVKEGTEVYVTVHTDGKDLYIRKDGEEVLKESFRLNEEEPVSSEILREYYISDSGKYVAYQVMGWEWNYVRVYEIEQEKYIFDGFGVVSFGFTDDEKHFYACTPTGMLGGEIKIYDVPSFNMKRDLLPYEQGVMVNTCYGYNPYNNTYKYSLTTDFQSEDMQTYHFDTDKVE